LKYVCSPIVDLSSFDEGGSQAERQKASDHLFSVCHELGFASIVGHGVPQNVLNDAFAMMKKMFDLPLEDKLKAPHPEELFPHRGYSKPGQEKAYSEEELEKAKLTGSLGKIAKAPDVKVRLAHYTNSFGRLILIFAGIIRDWFRKRYPQPQYLASRGGSAGIQGLGAIYVLGHRKSRATRYRSSMYGLSSNTRRDQAYIVSS